MDDVVLYFETEAQTGLPALRPGTGAALRFEPAELRDMEQEVARRYDRLARGSVRTLAWKDHEFTVTVGDGMNTRQPRLILKLVQDPVAAESLRPLTWTEGFLNDLEQLTAGLMERGALPGPELTCLRFALEELRAVVAATPTEFSRLLLVGYLQVTAQLFQARDEERAALYNLALRGLGSPAADRAPGRDTSSRAARVSPTSCPSTHSSGWLGRLFNRLLGIGPSEANGQ